MKRVLVASIPQVEGVVQEKFYGAPPQTPSCFAPPIKNPGGATDVKLINVFPQRESFRRCIGSLPLRTVVAPEEG